MGFILVENPNVLQKFFRTLHYYFKPLFWTRADITMDISDISLHGLGFRFLLRFFGWRFGIRFSQFFVMQKMCATLTRTFHVVFDSTLNIAQKKLVNLKHFLLRVFKTTASLNRQSFYMAWIRFWAPYFCCYFITPGRTYIR